MELKIINKKEEPLLARTKVESEIIFDKRTVSREEIKNKLGKDFGKDGKLIVVKGIYTKYGLKKATNLSYVYENEEALKRIEVVKKEKTGKKDPKPDEAEEKPEAKKEEQKPKVAKQEQKKGEKEAKQEQKAEQKETKPEAKKDQKPKKQSKEKEQ